MTVHIMECPKILMNKETLLLRYMKEDFDLSCSKPEANIISYTKNYMVKTARDEWQVKKNQPFT